MSILIKTINKRKYAYLAYRIGGKVVHKYLGPVSNALVASRISRLKSERRIPQEFSTLFWDTDLEKIDTRKHAKYIIERVLEMGDLNAFEWIQRLYPTGKVIETCAVSRRVSPKSRGFWEIWLGVHDVH